MDLVLTITVNPALDISATAPQVLPGPKLRLDQPRAEPGGGGVNVSRAVRLLGGQTRALVALGGATGARLQALLAAEGVEAQVIPLPGETRETLNVTDASTGAQFRFVLPGPVWDEALEQAALAQCRDSLGPGMICVLSGSQPPGMSSRFASDLARAAGQTGARLIVDTSGPALEALARSPEAGAAPHVLRMNRAEAEELSGAVHDTPAATAATARAMIRAGVADCVILARGAEGSVLATADGAWHASPPPVAVVSAVGAGDSFTGALALAMARGQGWPQALELATAAAAAAVTTPATALCPLDLTEALLPLCKAQPLSPA